MRIGISVSSSYRMDDPRVGARYMVERARAARQDVIVRNLSADQSESLATIERLAEVQAALA